MSDGAGRRKPQAFPLDEPGLVVAPPRVETPPRDLDHEPPAAPAVPPASMIEDIGRGVRWGGILLSALGGLATIALTLWFANFVSAAISRDDWIGWLSLGLAIVAGVAVLMLVLREVYGFFRLRRLGRIKQDAERALRERDMKLERVVVGRLSDVLGGRAELRWPIARLDEHARDVRDAGDLLRLADRDVLLVLDAEARMLVARAAKRVSVITALSPAAVLGVTYVMIENLRLVRALAGVYGGRPGFVGTARLARLVLGHIIATGGVAFTDDIIGQFLGHDIVRRLSRRLGEGMFNGALTARVGVAAIEVTRPLPYIEAPPIRLRDMLAEVFRKAPEAARPREPGAQS